MKKLLAVLASAVLLASCGGAKKDPIKPTEVVPATPSEIEASTNEGGEVVAEPIVDEATKEVVTEIDKVAEEVEMEETK